MVVWVFSCSVRKKKTFLIGLIDQLLQPALNLVETKNGWKVKKKFSIREIKTRVLRQTSDSRLRFLKINNEYT